MRRYYFLVLTFLTISLSAEDAAHPTKKKEIAPSILPHVWVSEALVYLKAQESRLSFANQAQTISGTTNFTNQALIQPHFQWNSGLRIDVGYQPKDWSFFATWTYINNRAQGNKATNGTRGFFPTLSLSKNISFDDYVTSATMSWELNTQLFDVGAIYSWNFYQHFLVKVHSALRIAFFDQRASIEYGGGIFDAGLDMLTMRNDFFGIGPCLGVSPNILLGGGFSIVADFSASALGSRFFVKQQEKYLEDFLYYQTRFLRRLSFMIDAKAALSWQKEFLYKSLVFSAQAGWEWHELFAQNQLKQNTFTFFNDNKNLLLRGGFISLCLAF